MIFTENGFKYGLKEIRQSQKATECKKYYRDFCFPKPNTWLMKSKKIIDHISQNSQWTSTNFLGNVTPD